MARLQVLDSRRPRLTDVARLADVSESTVSRALSKPHMVNPETRARISQALSALGYATERRTRADPATRSGSVGVVLPTLDNEIFSRALQAMQTVLSEGGYQLLVASNDYNPVLETTVVRDLLAHGIDGLILVGADRAAETRDLISDARIPVVLTWCDDPCFASVVVDNALAGRLAAEHLIALGHRRFGVVSGTLRTNDRQRQRVAGVRTALADVGLTLEDWCVSEQMLTLSGGRAGCSALLSLSPPPTAIIGVIDLLAVGALIEAQARGLVMPGDLSVVGIDNLELAGHLTPALTTVHVPTQQIGEEAARQVLLRLRGEDAPRKLELATTLVVRHSSGPAPQPFDLPGRAVRAATSS